MKLKHFGGYFTSMNEISWIILFPCSSSFYQARFEVHTPSIQE
jgi:hypothetical protein